MTAISLVTPSYCQAEYLEDAIRSVAQQSDADVEHLVLDGGSDDGSVEIIRRHEEQIDYWRSAEDDGQASAINEGWRRATGDVLGWLNSDDRLLPGALSLVAKTFERSPEARVVIGKCVVTNEHGERIELKDPTGYSVEDLLLGRSLPQPASFVSREVLETVGFLNESLQYALDWEFFVRVFAACEPGQIVYVDEPLAVDRQYGETKSATGGALITEERRTCLRRLSEETDCFDRSEVSLGEAVAWTYWKQALLSTRLGEYGRAAESVSSAIREHPSTLPAVLGRLPRTVRSLAAKRLRS